LENTFVLASDGKITLDALGKMMGVNRFRNEPVELLTLSACRTAAGDERAALGLAGIAIKAGARSALASLWFINDNASATLVANFYRQLKTAGFSKAKALQNAQLNLLDDERYEHPAYWAPFLLIGNWL
jgi:CHAT domain-containing protein